MNVISLDRWRVYCYLDDSGLNTIDKWFTENEVPDADRSALQARLDIYAHGGLRAISTSIVPLGDNFYALLAQRKDGTSPCPVFCEGPFSSDEITFLVGAFWHQEKKRPEPRYAKGIAEERVESLREDPKRRRLAKFT